MSERKTIFDLENKLDIDKEFQQISNILFNNSYSVRFYNYRDLSFIDAMNEYFFPLWPYRDTFIDIYEYLKFIGIDSSVISGYCNVDKDSFLYFLEFLVNIYNFTVTQIKNAHFSYNINCKVTACIANIKTILSKMHCKILTQGNQSSIIKANIDVDSVIDSVPEDISDALLNYCNFRIENNVTAKRQILKTIDLYIDKHKNELDKIDGVKNIRKDLDFIVNKLGINHSIDEHFSDLTDDELLNYYDSCFILTLDVLRRKKVHQIRTNISALKKKLEK